MNFHQRIHLQFIFGEPPKTREQLVIERSNNQQDRIRPRSSRFINLIFVNDEVLAQNWQINRGLHLPEIVERTRKVIFFSQHRHRNRTTCLVCPRDIDRACPLTNHPLRRRTPLEFSNDVDPILLQNTTERVRIRAPLRRTYPFALPRDYFRQHIHPFKIRVICGYGPLVASINSSSLRLASPLSIALAASFAPSRKSAAAPPRNNAAAAFMITSARASSVRSPASTALTISAFASASPPRRCSIVPTSNPNFCGSISNVFTSPFCASATCVLPASVISSNPSSPWTTHARSVPSPDNTCASFSAKSLRHTPIICRGAPAGLL